MHLHSRSAAFVVLLLVVPLALFLPFAVLIALPLALFAITLIPILYPCQLQRQYLLPSSPALAPLFERPPPSF
jgi:hypothetical protein